MQKERLTLLLQKHMRGTLTVLEKNELLAAIQSTQYKEISNAAIEEIFLRQPAAKELDEKRFLPLLTPILWNESQDNHTFSNHRSSAQSSRNHKIMWTLFTLAILLAAGAFFYFYKPLQSETVSAINNPPAIEILPGGDIAELTLLDGSTIDLDSTSGGLLTQQGNTRILKQAKGVIAYKASNEKPSTILFNTLTTPRGGQYKVILADGSRVRLNASSSITYPISFSEKERNVTITGEAYFEVAKVPNSPFKVKVYDMEVEALGTHFNINAYTDESSIRTTLLKGSAKLTKNTVSGLVQTSQQGQYNQDGAFTLLKTVDTNEVVAWKNGMFQFNNVDLKAAMRQISRWYDVDVQYDNRAPVTEKLVGEIRRSANLSRAIRVLKRSGVNCRIEGKTLIVMP